MKIANSEIGSAMSALDAGGWPEGYLNEDGDPTTLDYINSGGNILTKVLDSLKPNPKSSPTPSPTIVVQSPTTTKPTGLSTGAIIGIVSGGVLILGLIIVLAVRRR